MHTDSFNHHPGQLLLFTGTIQMGRPSLGSWIAYGLGSESGNLPGFVVLTSGPGGTSGGTTNFASGFLPSHYQERSFASRETRFSTWATRPASATPPSGRPWT